MKIMAEKQYVQNWNFTALNEKLQQDKHEIRYFQIRGDVFFNYGTQLYDIRNLLLLKQSGKKRKDCVPDSSDSTENGHPSHKINKHTQSTVTGENSDKISRQKASLKQVNKILSDKSIVLQTTPYSSSEKINIPRHNFSFLFQIAGSCLLTNLAQLSNHLEK